MKTAWLGVVLALTTGAAAGATAPAYPSKPVRLIVTFAPGGGTDIQARAIAQHVSPVFGQSIVIDNRPGAGGSLGSELGVRAEPDGYTLTAVSGSYGANAALYKLPFDSVADIQPISLIGTTGLLVTISPAMPIKSIRDLIAYAKSNPNKLNFGSAGTGGLGHLAGELFKLDAKIQFTHVPYKGTGPVMTALLSREVDSSFSSIVPSMPHVRAGRLRPLGITTAKRNAALPDVPTIGETVPGYEVTHWYAIWGPKGLPRSIVMRWNGEIAKLLQTDAMKKRLAAEGLEPAGGPPEQLAERLRTDVAKWKRVVREAKISLGK
ncbi:MAG: tripartite tricarboxylate transporter substrate binding protein [Betaproteobacteria bacterium]|nr:tripartite tricarboxylate transporter substrate binding protein [Betaproteobacteria bacterium]